MGREVVGVADQWHENHGRAEWKRSEDLSFTHGTVLYASHARMALSFEEVYD